MRAHWIFFTGIGLLSIASAVHAEFTSGLINVDFRLAGSEFPPYFFPEQVGAAVVGGDGDKWNSESIIADHTSGNLILASGVISNDVTYSLKGVTGGVIAGIGFMGDGYTVSTGNTMTIAVNGLTAFQPYDLYFYSGHVFDARTTTYTINGSSLTANSTGTPFGVGVFVEGDNYVHFSSKQADATGQITVSIQGSGGNSGLDPPSMGGMVNGFQITPVPEPATLLLFAIGAIGLLGIACRRQVRTATAQRRWRH